MSLLSGFQLQSADFYSMQKASHLQEKYFCNSQGYIYISYQSMSAITDKSAYNPVIENKKAVRISTVVSNPGKMIQARG